jgi:hypothetical protein
MSCIELQNYIGKNKAYICYFTIDGRKTSDYEIIEKYFDLIEKLDHDVKFEIRQLELYKTHDNYERKIYDISYIIIIYNDNQDVTKLFNEPEINDSIICVNFTPFNETTIYDLNSKYYYIDYDYLVLHKRR